MKTIHRNIGLPGSQGRSQSAGFGIFPEARGEGSNVHKVPIELWNPKSLQGWGWCMPARQIPDIAGMPLQGCNARFCFQSSPRVRPQKVSQHSPSATTSKWRSHQRRYIMYLLHADQRLTPASRSRFESGLCRAESYSSCPEGSASTKMSIFSELVQKITPVWTQDSKRDICGQRPAAAPCSGTCTQAPKRTLPHRTRLAAAPCIGAITQAPRRTQAPLPKLEARTPIALVCPR